MSSESKPDIRSCGFIVFREQPKLSFLLMQHSGRWDLPKGHMDPGESELQCALRELVEETGICEADLDICPDFRFMHHYQVTPKRFDFQLLTKELVVFLGTLKRDVDIELTEHIGFNWFEWDPPHQIQRLTIDPLLNHVDAFWSGDR